MADHDQTLAGAAPVRQPQPPLEPIWGAPTSPPAPIARPAMPAPPDAAPGVPPLPMVPLEPGPEPVPASFTAPHTIEPGESLAALATPAQAFSEAHRAGLP